MMARSLMISAIKPNPLILLLLLSTLAIAQHSQRSLPDDNLAYPVLITLKNGGTGFGFYLNDKAATYLVTAKHVLFDLVTGKVRSNELELLSYSKNLSDPTPNVITVDLSVLDSANIKPHPSEDIAVLELFSVRSAQSLSALSGVTVKQSAAQGLLGANLGVLRKFDQVLVGNEIVVMGYPTSLGLRAMPQIDSRRPLLRKGIVAGQNTEKRSIILDCPSYPGNSGGPALEVDTDGPFSRRYSIIGVIREFVPYADGGKTFTITANSGYSVATPLDFVLELIK